MKITVRLQCELPTNLLAPFLQHVRDFDAAHDEVASQMWIDASEESGMTLAEAQAILRSVHPPFPYMAKWRKTERQ